MFGNERAAGGEDEDGREQPRVLYTGTGRRYLLQMLDQFGEFAHRSGEWIYLDPSLCTPCSRAVQRANQYGDRPVLLVVDAQKVSDELKYEGEYKVRGLSLGSFLPYELHSDENGKIPASDFESIKAVEEYLIGSTVDEVRQGTQRTLHRLP